MPRRRLIWQLFPPFLLLVLLAIGSVTWLFTHAVEDFYLEQTRHDLEARARLVQPLLAGHMQQIESAHLDRLSKQLGDQTATRLTVIQRQGIVLADSDEDPERMDNHADRPEVATALDGSVGVSTRFSHTLQQSMMYVAIPVYRDGRIVGCVRTALPLSEIDRTLSKVFYQVASSGLAIVLLAALFCLWISRRLSRPIEEMKHGAERFARGELDRRLPVYPGEELGALAEAMNQMAVQLDDRIRTVVRQRNEQEAVLASMIEGVFAVDQQERLIRVNQAVTDLLDLPGNPVGRRIHEVLRKPDLLKFVASALASRQRIEAEITLVLGGEERFLQAHGTPLRDAKGTEIGALIVLNDITRLQRLENIRRDFVANVSHELKTPITAIKGSVETLMAGAVEEKESAERFLQIIARQSDRLNAIIEDLLALSRIEQDEEKAGIQLTRVNLRDVLQSALQACQIKAQEKSLDLQMDSPEAVSVQVNPALLEQALVNLVDNAIKYSPEGGRVRITARRDSQSLTLEVRDWGAGIAQEHLPRLFERFYRVDKARSRKLGGTGLGLAIVKHIIQAHNGRIEVRSEPGSGTTFSIEIPQENF